MKPRSILAVIACTGVVAFLIGKMNSSDDDAVRKEKAGEKVQAVSSRSNRALGESEVDKDKARPRRVTTETKAPQGEIDAAGMTREERLELLAKGAAVFNSEAQIEKMVAVIGALQAGEMREAAELIGKAQRNGNPQASQVWTALWLQWGKTDPLDCFARFRERPEGKGPGDARTAMRGWLEANPSAALAWAKEPGRSALEASAAAMALSHAADGDPVKLQADLQSMPEGEARKMGIRELFDLEVMKDNGRGAMEIYDSLPDALKVDAWGATAKRLATTDQDAAKAWVTQHAGQPGTDYVATTGMVRDLARKDPEGTAKWALNLPATDDSSPEKLNGPPHPVILATSQWALQDSEAAQAWLRTLPAEQVWARTVLDMIEKSKKAGTSQK